MAEIAPRIVIASLESGDNSILNSIPTTENAKLSSIQRTFASAIFAGHDADVHAKLPGSAGSDAWAAGGSQAASAVLERAASTCGAVKCVHSFWTSSSDSADMKGELEGNASLMLTLYCKSSENGGLNANMGTIGVPLRCTVSKEALPAFINELQKAHKDLIKISAGS